MKRIHLLVLLSALALLLAAASARGSGSGSLVVGEVYAAGSCSAASGLEDLVGYGSAADYEGSGAAPAGSATNALARADSCTDTDDNAADFVTAAPDPKNSSAAPSACSVSPPPDGASGSAGVDVDIQPLLSIALDHPTLSFPAGVPGTTPSPLPEHVTGRATT